MIVSVLLVLNVAQGWLQQMMKLKLRELADARPPRRVAASSGAPSASRGVGEVGTNPDQRIQPDAQHLTELSRRSRLRPAAVVAAAGELRRRALGPLGAASPSPDHGHHFTIPGYMVWCALIYAAAGSWLAWLVGRPLVRLNADALRARGRSPLRAGARPASRPTASPSMAASPRERRTLGADHDDVLASCASSSRPGAADLGHRRLWLARPRRADHRRRAGLFRRQPLARRPDHGGRRLQPGAAGAALVRRQFPPHRRLAGDAAAGGALPRRPRSSSTTSAQDAERIALGRHPAGKLAFDNLSIRASADWTRGARRAIVEVDCGERVLIAGYPAAARASCCWRSQACGRREPARSLPPPAGEMMFMPPRPLPAVGPCAPPITYPASREGFAMRPPWRAARVGLGRLIARLAERSAGTSRCRPTSSSAWPWRGCC